MSTPTVMRVQPVYEKAHGQKRTLVKTHAHNCRTDGNLLHVDSSRTHLNQTLYGTGDIVADVQNIANQYARSSKKGPCAGEIILTANADFFKKLSEAQKEKWAKDSLAWALKEFDGKGQGRVANCTWHRDEKAEHLHIVVVPVSTTTVGNQHKQKIIEAINYSAVLGKPVGGEKHLPPAERRWGIKQTSYANFMAEHGHDLIRGVRNRKLKNVTPTAWKTELYSRFARFIEDVQNVPDRGKIEFSKQEIVQFIMAQVESKTFDLAYDQKRLLNQVASLEQALADSAKTLGCDNPAFLPQYCQDLVASFEKSQPKVASLFSQFSKNVAAERLERERIQKEQIAASQISTPTRHKKGERKTKEQRREARTARKAKTCPPWLIAHKHQQFNSEVSVCLQNCNAPQ